MHFTWLFYVQNGHLRCKTYFICLPCSKQYFSILFYLSKIVIVFPILFKLFKKWQNTQKKLKKIRLLLSAFDYFYKTTYNKLLILLIFQQNNWQWAFYDIAFQLWSGVLSYCIEITTKLIKNQYKSNNLQPFSFNQPDTPLNV